MPLSGSSGDRVSGLDHPLQKPIDATRVAERLVSELKKGQNNNIFLRSIILMDTLATMLFRWRVIVTFLTN